MGKARGLIAIVFAIAITMSLAGCSSFIRGFEDGIKEYSNDEVTDNTDNTDNKDDNNSEMGKEAEGVKEVASKMIDAAINGEDLTDFVVNMVDGEPNNDTVITSEKIEDAMRNGENVWILVKSSDIGIESIEKKEKGVYEVNVKNDINETATLRIVDVNGEWKLDINEIVGDLYIEVPKGVTVSIDGKEVSKDYIETTTDHDIYRIPNMLNGTISSISYDTGLSEKFSGEALVGTAEPNDMVYRLSDKDLEILIPEAERLWKGVREAALANDMVKINSLLADRAGVTAEGLEKILGKNNYGLALQSFSKRTDEEAQSKGYISKMDSVGTYTLYMVGKFTMPTYIVTAAPSCYCWVQVVKDEDGYKILNVSREVWLEVINPYYSDK